MYKLVSVDRDGMIFFGTFVKCLRRGRRLWKRLGFRGTIYRPDGSNLREPYRYVRFPGSLIAAKPGDKSPESSREGLPKCRPGAQINLEEKEIMEGTIVSIKRYGLKNSALVEVKTDTDTVQVDAYSFIGTVGSKVEFNGEQLRKDGPIVVVNLWAA